MIWKTKSSSSLSPSNSAKEKHFFSRKSSLNKKDIHLQWLDQYCSHKGGYNLLSCDLPSDEIVWWLSMAPKRWQGDFQTSTARKIKPEENTNIKVPSTRREINFLVKCTRHYPRTAKTFCMKRTIKILKDYPQSKIYQHTCIYFREIGNS